MQPWQKVGRPIHPLEAALPLLVTASLLLASLLIYPVRFYWPLAVGTLVAGMVARHHGFNMKSLAQAVWGGMKATLIVLSILLLVGALIGVWMGVGTVPTLVYYGLSIASPHLLVPMAFLLALAVSMLLGTSVGTLSTLGVAIMGVAHGAGASTGLVAGALVSGALFGDRSSPLSGSLNLTAAMTGTDLREVMRLLWRTGGPALLVTFLLYAGTALLTAPAGAGDVGALRVQLAAAAPISPWLLLPPVTVLLLSLLRVRVVWALGVGIFIALFVGVVGAGLNPADLIRSGLMGHVAATSDPSLDRILGGGGMVPMRHQVLLLLTAGALNGIMESTGMMALVLDNLVRRIRRPSTLVASTMAISVAAAMVAANQALAIIIPGRMLRDAYVRSELPATLLARALADSGTLFSGLIPWNVMAVLASTAIGVPVLSYAPYAFLAWVLPLLSLWVTHRELTQVADGIADHIAAGDD